jgi:Fic family protein
MATGTYLTLGQASKETGISKPTLSKALKSGRLSYVEKTSAGYKIDPAELFRVFPKQPQETVSSEHLDTPREPPIETSHLQAVLDAKELIEKELRQQIDDLRSDRDEWRKQAQQLALAAPTEATGTRRKGLFGLWGS